MEEILIQVFITLVTGFITWTCLKLWNAFFNVKNIKIIDFFLDSSIHIKNKDHYSITENYYSGGRWSTPFPYLNLILQNNLDNAAIIDSIYLKVKSTVPLQEPILNIDIKANMYYYRDSLIGWELYENNGGNLLIDIKNVSASLNCPIKITKVDIFDNEGSLKISIPINKKYNFYPISLWLTSKEKESNPMGYGDRVFFFDEKNIVSFEIGDIRIHYVLEKGGNKIVKERDYNYNSISGALFYNNIQGFYIYNGERGGGGDIEEIDYKDLLFSPNIDNKGSLFKFDLGKKYKIPAHDVLKIKLRLIPTIPCTLMSVIKIKTSSGTISLPYNIEINYTTNDISYLDSTKIVEGKLVE